MESDDDFQPESLTPLVHERKLKRLKKAIRDSTPEAIPTKFEAQDSEDSIGEDVLEESREPLQSMKRLENFDAEAHDSEDSIGEVLEESNEPLQSMKRLENFDAEDEMNFSLRLDGEEDGFVTRTALGFDSVTEDIDGEGGDMNARMDEESVDLTMEELDKKRHRSDVLEDGKISKKKRKNKRVERVGDDEVATVKSASKKMSEKERRELIKQLRAESQRLLRETRDAAFKPVPLVKKPISWVLEKIRRRKLELSKSAMVDEASIDANDGLVVEIEKPDLDERGSERVKLANERRIQGLVDMEGQTDAISNGESRHGTNQPSCDSIPSHMGVDDDLKHASLAPMEDTSELFSDTQISEKDELLDDTSSSPLEEVLAPSKLAMNLKNDFASSSDDSDAEDNDKENINPQLHVLAGLSLSPRGDPVKAFVDDEAEEEDDSDNDQRLQENEEDGDTDSDEVNDIIATGYEEEPIDIEKRNELHQKWLEQQDAAGTENYLQKFKCGPKLRERVFLEVDDEEGEDENDEYGDGAKEDVDPSNVARMNLRNVKQTLPQMFTDEDDTYLSDDEETEKRLTKQKLFEKSEEKAVLLSPVEDKSYEEVFGLIKKLNVVPDTKKKPKLLSAFLDMPLTGGNNNLFSKSSFLHRGSNHSLPPSQKNGSSTFRSFVFGRDDSSSRSTISEEASDKASNMTHQENWPAKTASAKFSYSQVKSTTQNSEAGMKSGTTSLFQILRQSSIQSKRCNIDKAANQTETLIEAFKLDKMQLKKPITMKGRT